jgi:hypothetical protein
MKILCRARTALDDAIDRAAPRRLACGTAGLSVWCGDAKAKPENAKVAAEKVECHALVGRPQHLAFAATCIKRPPPFSDAWSGILVATY